jgi:hypothetical protein
MIYMFLKMNLKNIHDIWSVKSKDLVGVGQKSKDLHSTYIVLLCIRKKYICVVINYII